MTSPTLKNCSESLPDGLGQAAAPFPAVCVHHLISTQAELTPVSIAVEFEQAKLTYAELEARSNQLARFLMQRGAARRKLVGLCIERSEQMLVALLAIQKTGAAYVPLDPAYPKDRLQWILQDSNVSVLVTQEALLATLPEHQATIVCLDRDRADISKASSQELECGVTPEEPIYVIYTSGSTGRPKGVQIPHRAVVNLLASVAREPGMSADDVLVGVTTLSFDIAGLEMYLPATVGAKLVIAPQAVTCDGFKLASLLERSGATVMQATPATWRMLLDTEWQGNPRLKILCGGEALPRELANRLLRKAHSVWNLYGPTETTIWSAVEQVEAGSGPVLLGRPLANTQFYVVDETLEPVSAGEPGELCIGGAGLALGYFQRPDLTREKFVVPAFLSESRSPIYRTGDLARLRADGKAEFLGRIDHQVKIRGFRIELGEIEAVLEEHSRIRQAVVIAREYGPGDTRLVAYIVGNLEGAGVMEDIRAALKSKLPDYMVPAAFVVLGSLPLTPNGKVDRKLLPAPSATDYISEQAYVAPRDKVEKRVAEIVESITGIKPIGVNTDLLHLGVHSLLAARIFMKLSREFGKDLPLATLFKAPTIGDLSQILRPDGAPTAWPTLVPIQAHGSKPPFFCVHGGAGTTLFLKPLAQHLGLSQPFYSLEPQGLDGKRITRKTVEAMAQHYISEVRKIQPQGPYQLGGYCFGGLVAFEMARMLKVQGQLVTMVAMFNAPLRFNGRVSKLRVTVAKVNLRERLLPHSKRMKDKRLAARFGHASGVLGNAVRWRALNLARIIRIRSQVKACRFLSKIGVTIPQALRGMYVLSMTHVAERAYVPQIYDGKITLFRGLGLYDDPQMGWDGLAATIEPIEVAGGTHRVRRDMMNEPIVAALAGRFAAALHEAQRQPIERTMPVIQAGKVLQATMAVTGSMTP